MNVDRLLVERLRETLRVTAEHVEATPQTVEVNRDVAIGLLKGSVQALDQWLDGEPAWRPISEVPGPVPSAWIFVPNTGVMRGDLGRFNDGCVFGHVASLHGCIVRDWGATMWMPCPVPEAPKP